MSLSAYHNTNGQDTYTEAVVEAGALGFSDEDPLADRAVYNGLGAGHRMGLFAASDNHDGWTPDDDLRSADAALTTDCAAAPAAALMLRRRRR